MVGCPGSDAASEGTRDEVFERFSRGDLFGLAGDRYLAMDGNPREEQGYAGIAGYLLCLTAFEIGEEDEAFLIVGLEQDGSLPGLAVLVDGRQSEGVGLDDLKLLGLAEPMPELGDGIGVEVFPMQTVPCVVFA